MNKHHQSLPFALSSFVLISVFLVFSGCGGGYPGKERLYPVSITITENGAPFTNAAVVLLRESGPTIINGGGVTGENGIAKIKVDAKWNGVPTGKYKVMINKENPFQGDLSDEEYRKLDLDAQEAYNKRMYAKRMSMPLPVPAILRGMKSPLTIEVISSGDNTASFDIGEY